MGEDRGAGIRLLRKSTSFGRKRVVSLPASRTHFVDHFDYISQRTQSSFGRSPLQDLPQEILIKIVCGVEHEDLKQLLLVCKAMKEATLIAKQCHFAYSTPRKTLRGLEEILMWSDVEAPNAPRQPRLHRRSLTPKKLAAISIALFSPETETN